MDHNNAGDNLAGNSAEQTAELQYQCFIQKDLDRYYVETLKVDKVEKHFVFHGQCLVLGDPGVGKTSLVKSLTGRPFDPSQPKTQGIEQSLVDKTWKNQSMKELVLGDLWKFLALGFVNVLLVFGTGVNVLVHQYPVLTSRFLKMFGCSCLTSLLLLPFFWNALAFFAGFIMYVQFMFFVTAIMPSCVFFLNYNVRFRLVTLSVILRRCGLTIGFVLALLICYFNETYIEFASTRGFLLLAIITGITFVALFLSMGPIPLPFASGHKNMGQLLTNRHFLVIFYFCRLPLSVSIGLIFGFAVAYLDLISVVPLRGCLKITCPVYVYIMINSIFVHFFWLVFALELAEEAASVSRFILSVKNGSWGPYNVLLFVLVYYFCKLAWTSPTFFCLMLFPLFTSYSLYKEWFCIDLITSLETSTFSNKLITCTSVKGIIQINKNMLKNALKDKFTSLNLKIIDFAGDKEYIAYHHMFFRRQAVNIIVFNMTKFAENYFKAIKTETERLKFWFESVCSHVPPKTPILLVGTHRGNMATNCMKILDKHLRRCLWNAYCDELVVNDVEDLIFFPVENSKGNKDAGVQALQKKIISAAEECKESIRCEIPLSWIRIQDEIIRYTEKKEANFCVTLDRFSNVFDNFICNSWSKETLKYFHEKGLVIYLEKKRDLNLSNWVLLKPELLVDIIVQLINPPTQKFQERGLRCAWSLLQKKGMLTKSLLRRIISKVQENEEAMTAFLEECDLICPLINKKVETCSLSDEQPTHFVPSLLPMLAEGDTPIWRDDDTDKKCYVFFNRFLPEPLFHRLLSHAHKHSKMVFPNGQTVLFRNSGKFWTSARHPHMYIYSLKLLKKEKMIGVTFSCSENHAMRPSDVLCHVFSMVDDICKRDFPFVKFHCGPACPSHKCPGHQPDYLSDSAGEEQGPRRHVYNVMPGRQGDKIASLYCENYSFAKELNEWVP